MTKLSGVDWYFSRWVKDCDYDIVEHLLDVTAWDDGSVTKFFAAFYRDNTPGEFVLSHVSGSGETLTRRLFEGCEVVKHKVSAPVEQQPILSHAIVLRYENLIVS